MEATFSVDYLIQLFVSGLTRGSIYALLALGYSMVYGIVQLINFAHGEIYMIGAFSALIASSVLVTLGLTGLPLVITVIVIGTMVSMMFGITLDRIAYKPLRESPRLSLLISAIGMSIFLQNFVLLTQTSKFLPVPKIFPESWNVLGIDGLFNKEQIIILCVSTVIMVVLTLLIKYTNLGKAMRATSQDSTMAQLLGIEINRVIAITFLVGSGIAAIGSILISQYIGQINFYMGFLVGVKAFVAAVLGGIGSIPGAVLGSYILGMVESFGAGYLSSSYEDVFAFLFLVVFLIYKPNGILGKNIKEKV